MAVLCLLFLGSGLWLGNRVSEQRQLQPTSVIVTTIYQPRASSPVEVQGVVLTASGTSIRIRTQREKITTGLIK